MESPTEDVPCPAYTDPLKDDFQADSGLVDFLTQSTLSLQKKVGGQNNDTDQRKNICNPDRQIDITTVYLARALGLTVSTIVANFIFDESRDYVFPGNASEIFPPVNITQYWNLEQTYWTIISQYTAATEPLMRLRHRSNKWCWTVGKGMYDHCEETKQAASCSNGATGTPHNHCRTIWKFFVEACHRVHSISTSQDPYKVYGSSYPEDICIPTQANLELYELSRL